MSFLKSVWPQGDTYKGLVYSVDGLGAMFDLSCGVSAKKEGQYFVAFHNHLGSLSNLSGLIEALQDAKEVGDAWVEYHKAKPPVILTDSRKAYADELIHKMGCCWCPDSEWKHESIFNSYQRVAWNSVYEGALPWLFVNINEDHLEVGVGSNCKTCIRMPWSTVEVER